MTIKQQGGIFGRNPTFNDVTVEGDLSTNGSVEFTGDLTVNNSVVDLAGNSSLVLRNGTVLSPSSGYLKDAFLGNADGVMTYAINGASNGAYGQQSFVVRKGDSSDPLEAIRLKTNGDVSLPTGNLVVTSGQGIDFSATSGTGTSELFDDYEEGTWTGTYGGNTATGTYTKIGRAVYVDILLSANSASFGSITGLPYASGGGGYTGGFTWGRVFRMDTLDANGVPCRISVSGTQLTFTTNVTTGADGVFTVTSDASGTVRAGLSGVYYV